jgi:hypothetical protein
MKKINNIKENIFEKLVYRKIIYAKKKKINYELKIYFFKYIKSYKILLN